MPEQLLARYLIDPEAEIHFARLDGDALRCRPHSHDFCELFLMLSGTVEHHVNGGVQRLESCDLAFIRPDDVHTFEPVGSTPVWALNLAFPLATLAALEGFVGSGYDFSRLTQPETAPVQRLSASVGAEMARRMEELPALSASGKGRTRSALRVLLAEWITRSFLEPPPNPTSSAPAWVRKLTAAMRQEEHYLAGVSRLYELAPFSEEHVCRVLRRHLGRTPTEWVNDLRLDHAARLLRATDAPVAAVAMDSGFANLGHFYRLFRLRFGVAPASWRRRMAA